MLEAPPPAFSAEDAARIAAETFGARIRGEPEPLESERDQNFRVRCEERGELVLRFANAAEDPAVLDLQTRALEHVARCDPGLPVPRVLPARSGSAAAEVEAPDTRRHQVRLLTYLSGRPIGDATPGPALLRALGATLARLDQALRGFSHPAARHALLWDAQHASRLTPHLAAIPDPARRDQAARRLDHFTRHVLPVLPGLRAQVIHNDVSRHNTLVTEDGSAVGGIIDFGDMVHAPLVQDVAVTATEMMLGEEDPAALVAPVVSAYARIEPLRQEERALLFDLIATRLAMGVVISAWRVRRHPENRHYITADDDALWRLLDALDELEPALRAACQDAA